ncbi:MAG: homoserine kinase [Deltaproteobacteria bacterium]|nr:homoserine kinase [Deltaproteobacteria bacterium]MBV8454409.1 homoserine kinase [Deltaproteobacteria bacterium]
MAVYTELKKTLIDELADDYNLGRITDVIPIPDGSVNSNYVIEAGKARLLLRIDEVKSEGEVKREIDLLAFLRKHSFPCPHPLQDRMGRVYREYDSKCLSLFRYVEGRVLPVARLRPAHLENIGRALGELHVIGKGYKKGIDNRFSFERIADLYIAVRGRLPNYFRKITRTLEDEIEYLTRYLEGKLPKGIIHGDLFADNMLFRGEKLIVMLDFEAACRGKFIFDIATAVNALCFLDGGYSLDRFRNLLHGYESVRTLSLAEWDAFPNELRYSSLRFTVTRLHDFFLRPANGSQRVNKDFHEFFERLRVLRREREGGMEALLMAMATGYDYRKYQKVKAGERLKA